MNKCKCNCREYQGEILSPCICQYTLWHTKVAEGDCILGSNSLSKCLAQFDAGHSLQLQEAVAVETTPPWMLSEAED